MSGFRTHMLFGGVSGLALAHYVPSIGDMFGLPPLVATPVIVGGSMVVATLADIDEEHSWASRHVRIAMTLCGAALGVITGGALGKYDINPAIGIFTGLLIGAVVGAIVGRIMLLAVRRGLGGHRRLSHSLVSSGTLTLIALVLAVFDQNTAAALLGTLAYGLVVHLPPDLVTPSGVPLLWPLTKRRFHILPRAITPYGEGLIVMVTLIVGALLLYVTVRA